MNEDTIALDESNESELKELGSASKMTQGSIYGIWTEPSVLPQRTTKPCPTC